MADQDKNPSSNEAYGGLEPGESNRRAVRNDAQKQAAAETGDQAAGTELQPGQRRVRMLRTEGERTTNQVVTVSDAEADHLIDSGAAEAVQHE